ncbi:MULTISPECIES: acyltransferase [unclassified Achromobacter]|uniref:acyltransferase family protein n=1 Tax=unclassified Achromobacter TaxID=2626865 RepID=UPI000B51B5F8|nr:MULTISPECIES: acyltransferase [unclassified Achromobacter]OWT68101.1 hypothetical protein CEY05_29140 [Achromobacter sp. HZ34]OWT69938.1 hypothetical protein CEY04_27970 [Achromobacter sp. HZ28]
MFRTGTIVRPVAYPAIDGLRIYAALAVFIEHVAGGAAVDYFKIPGAALTYQSDSLWMKALAYLLDGNHGVDVFFIISGFLMARIVLSTRTPFSYGSFLLHRFTRIYPAFLIALILVAAGDVFLFGWPWKPMDFAKNLIFLNAIPSLGVTPYNNVTWSLGFEFAFYLVVPVLTLGAAVIDKRVAAIIMLAAAFWWMPDTYVRMLGMFAGAVIGSMDDALLRRIARMLPLSLVIVAYLACGILKVFWFKTYLGYYYTFLAVASIAFVKVVWDDRSIIARALSARPVRFLGTLSYSIYLYHPIIFSIVLYKMTPWPASPAGFVWYAVATTLTTLVVAYLSYMLVERPYFTKKPPAKASAEITVPA